MVEVINQATMSNKDQGVHVQAILCLRPAAIFCTSLLIASTLSHIVNTIDTQQNIQIIRYCL